MLQEFSFFSLIQKTAPRLGNVRCNNVLYILGEIMELEIYIEWNVHMYNHMLHCEIDGVSYEAICESAPTKIKTIIFWPIELKIPDSKYKYFIDLFNVWVEKQPFESLIREGKRT